MIMRRVVVTLATMLLVATNAHAGWKDTNVISGSIHRENGVVWQTGIRRHSSDDCKRREGPQAAGPCERAEILIRSESAVPIQCSLAVHRDTKDWTINIVVYPLEEIEEMYSVGPALPDAGGVTSSCKPLPAEMPLAPEPGSCSIKIEVPGNGDPDQFYPPGAKRRLEQGVVIIDFDVRHDRKELLNPVVVRSGGYSSLDSGALRMFRSLEASAVGCLAGRARRGIQFVIKDEAGRFSPSDQTIMPSEVIRVQGIQVVRVAD